jgi:hypothetical protein
LTFTFRPVNSEHDIIRLTEGDILHVLQKSLQQKVELKPIGWLGEGLGVKLGQRAAPIDA